MYRKLIFHKRLRRLRQEHGFTQSELATLADVTPLTYSKYERGESIPSSVTLIKLCDALGVSADYLLGRSDHKHSKYASVETITGLSENSVSALKALQDQRHALLSILDFLLGIDIRIDYENYYDCSYSAQDRYFDEDDQEVTIPPTAFGQEIAAEWYDNDHPHIPKNTDNPYASIVHLFSEKEKVVFKSITRRQKRQVPSSELLWSIYYYLVFDGDYSIFGCGHGITLTTEHPIHIGAKGLVINYPSAEADKYCEYALERNVIASLKKFKRLYRKHLEQQKKKAPSE